MTAVLVAWSHSSCCEVCGNQRFVVVHQSHVAGHTTQVSRYGHGPSPSVAPCPHCGDPARVRFLCDPDGPVHGPIPLLLFPGGAR